LNQPFRFQGQQFDEETGLHYNRHRYYDPGVGRYLSQDPIGLRGGSNLFAYAPNPIAWTDPLGLVKASGSADVHRFVLNTGPHFSVELNGIHTDQVIIDAQRNTTIRNTRYLPTLSKTLSVDLSSTEASNALQEKLTGSDTGIYSANRNSCLHHCADVLHTGDS
jgi:RHS repeat-associated protein